MTQERLTWFTKHLDTVIVLGTLAAGFLWLNGKFNAIESDLKVIKTVLILKGILPESMAHEVKE